MVIQYRLELTKNKIPALVKQAEYEYDRIKKFDTQEKIIKLLNACMRLNVQAEEHVVMIAFDVKLHLLGLFELSHGSISQAMLPVQNVFSRALLIGASGIIIAHNHPSGDCTPSHEDDHMVRILKDASKIFDIQLLDFLILSCDDHFSMIQDA